MPEVKIATTRGYPRFRLAYECLWWRDLGPDRRLWPLEWPEFREGYLAQLEELAGRDALLARCRQAATDHHAPGVVLACFEDLRAGERCHREILSEYLGAAEVPDDGPLRRRRRTPTGQQDQPTLFEAGSRPPGMTGDPPTPSSR